MAPSSVTSVSTTHEDPSQYLATSIGSLSSQRAQSSWLAKTYRQAAQLYLTRRLKEALDAIEPVVLPETFFSGNNSAASSDEDASRSIAPIAQSSRGTRVKVWSFYLTLINAIIELGPEEGKLALGSQRHKTLVSRARTGSVWDEVVRHGYGGNEGQVDGEVIANLYVGLYCWILAILTAFSATLLLTHMPDQRLNQQRLESYLSASMYPAFDITAHMAASQNGRPHPTRTDSTGTSTPRDLNTRLKLLELYTLHILPWNEQWDYARDFITMSAVLDEERRDAFLDALQNLREEKSLDAIREAEREKAEALRRQREAEEAKARREREEAEAAAAAKRERSTPAPTPNGGARPAQQPAPRRLNRAPARRPPAPPPPTFYQRLVSLQTTFMRTMQHNPLAALRYLLFVFALLLALARRDVRTRVRRVMDDALRRSGQTFGMATKVSYV